MSHPNAALLLDAPSIVDEVMREIWGTGSYDSMHISRTDLERRVAATIAGVAEAISGDGRLSAAACDAAREIGHERALLGVPIQTVLQSWTTAERICVQRFLAALEPGSAADTRASVSRLNEAFRDQMRICAEEYTQTIAEVTVQYDRVVADLVSRALGGEPIALDEFRAQARSIGVDVTEAYAVVVVTEPSLVNSVRIERLVLSYIARAARGRLLVGRVNRDLVVLAPASHLELAELRAQLEACLADPGFPADEQEIMFAISEELGALDRLEPVFARAREASEAARARGMHRGVVCFDEVALDVVLQRSPDAAAVLAAALGPLGGREDLVATLEQFYRQGMSIRATSRAMFLHHNTVAHRLKLIEQSLGRKVSDVWGMLEVILAVRMRQDHT